MDLPPRLRRTDGPYQTTNGDENAYAVARNKYNDIRQQFAALVQNIIVGLDLKTGHEGPGDLSAKVARELDRLLEDARVE